MNSRVVVRQNLLKHPFGISRGTTSSIPVFLAEMEGGGIGEGSPVRYRNESAEEGAGLVRRMLDGVSPENLFEIERHMARAREIAPNHSSARACFDLALHDRIGKNLNIPLYKFIGQAPVHRAISSFTIALDSNEKMVEKVKEARRFPMLKVKLGRKEPGVDVATLRAIRGAAPDKVLRVDANAGWTLDVARECIKVAADLGVEFVEQPLAIGNLEQLAELKRSSPLPIIADEDALDLQSLPALVGRVDGINIKLMKCGGLHEARQMIAFGRAVGWRLMMGCMIETSVAIAAASHLASAMECIDLDSEQLIVNNPAGPNVLGEAGCITTPNAPGIGVHWTKSPFE